MDTLVIRTATTHDQDDIRRLAALDEDRVPAGRMLLATVDGELTAAVAIDSGTAIADPFRATADAVALLRAQARRIRVDDRSRTTFPERLGIRRPLARTA